MAKTQMNITADVCVGVPLEQAQRALRIVEWFLNDNRDVDAIAERKPDGTISLRFERKAKLKWEEIKK